MVNYIGPPEMAPAAAKLYDELAEIMRHYHPYIQNIVLADLLALFLAGHFTADRDETERIREKMLAEHVEWVRKMIGKNEEIIAKKVYQAVPKH
jgi:hypothetical protein